MQRYREIKQVGDGTYGTVSKGVNKKTNKVVAIKKMKNPYYSWEECVKLREVQSLKKLSHVNIVKLKEVIRENDILYFVFEFVDKNLYQLMKETKGGLKEEQIRKYIYQILLGLEHTHFKGYFHRDMKPENLLVGSEDIVKIADFGLARDIRSRPPFTDYVSTRWYRAPEVLLRDTKYNSPIDLFALGAIMAELYTSRPLFPGTSEPDQLYKLASVMGSPCIEKHPETMKLAAAMNYKFPQFVKTPLKQLVPNACKEAIDLMELLLRYEPRTRPTATQALKHAYFRNLDKESVNVPKTTSSEKKGSSSSASMLPTPQPQQKINNFSSSSSLGKSAASSYGMSAVSLPSVGNAYTGRSSKTKNRMERSGVGLGVYGMGSLDEEKQTKGYGNSRNYVRGSALKKGGESQFGSFNSSRARGGGRDF
jgi:protein kinase